MNQITEILNKYTRGAATLAETNVALKEIGYFIGLPWQWNALRCLLLIVSLFAHSPLSIVRLGNYVARATPSADSR